MKTKITEEDCTYDGNSLFGKYIEESQYHCRKCKDGLINWGDNFCPNCGAKVRWNLKEDNP